MAGFLFPPGAQAEKDQKDFAYLGDILFKAIPIAGLDERYCYQFAEHQVIEGKPLLQYVADNLDELNLSLRFHFSFCDPSKEMKKLKDAADKHAPLVLQFFDGAIGGRLVITELQKTTEVTADNGRVLSLDVRVTLKEWFDPEPIKTRQLKQKQNAPGLQSGGAMAKPVAAKQSALAAGALKVSAAVVGAAAKVMGTLASGLSKVMTAAGPTIDQIKSAADGITAQVGPIMQEAQGIAAGVQEAGAMVQGYVSNIASYSSAVTRILSGLPGPAGKLGARIASVNNKISGEATKMMTMTSLVQGGAVEAGARAQMITRMLPKKDVPQ